MSTLDNAEWEELLAKVKRQGAALDADARRRTMTVLAETLGATDIGKDDRPGGSAGRPRKLRSFSGSKDAESGVVDFETWRLYARPLVEDRHLHESEKKRLLVESLLRPALEIATSLDPDASSEDILDLLENHYGEVSDGFEMYTQFRSSIQEVKETATEYLQRLHLLALKTAQRDGMRKKDIPREVVRQFENGCADEDLLSRIGIRDLCEDDSILPVGDLLLLVRTEESRRREKKLRLKARNARANMLKVQESNMAAEMASLQQKVEALTLQLQGQTASGTQAVASSSAPYAQPGAQSAPVLQPHQHQGYGPGPQRGQVGGRRGQRRGGRNSGVRRGASGFCFLCGQDGHYQSACSFPRNAEFVQQRLLSSVQGASNSQQGQGNEWLPLVTWDEQWQSMMNVPPVSTIRLTQPSHRRNPLGLTKWVLGAGSQGGRTNPMWELTRWMA